MKNKLIEGDAVLESELMKRLKVMMDCSNQEAEQRFKHCINAIKSLLLQDHSVTIPGFGRFSVKRKAARIARHPQTGHPLPIPAKAVPIFKAGDAFKLKFYHFLEDYPTFME
jgi:nucleoid DNA-binding protein